MAKRVLRTKLCDMLEIEYPIILAGMAGVAGPTLAAAVSNAGGLGVLGALTLTPEQLHDWIRKTRSLTNKPFGVDTVVPVGLPNSATPEELDAQLPAELVASVNKLKKEIGVPDMKGPGWWALITNDVIRSQIEVCLEERVPVFASGLGNPASMVPNAHAQGMKVLALVGNVKNARRIAEGGVDVVAAQGYEAGGHTGRIGTLALVPQVVDAVYPTPVVAAGGIADGRGLAAALALGATGVWCGSAFLPTYEAGVECPEIRLCPEVAIDIWKQKILSATEEDTRVTKIYTGKTARHINNKLIETWERAGVSTLPMPLQGWLIDDLYWSLMVAGKTDYVSGYAGQIAGMLKEIKSAKQVVDDMVEGAVRILEEVFPTEVSTRD